MIKGLQGIETKQLERPHAPIVIEVLCPDMASAEAIAGALVGGRLAAAVNVSAPVRSHYVWQGDPVWREETGLTIKTRAALFEEVAAEVRRLHPYAVPSILARLVGQADQAYLDWILEATRRADNRTI